jgi:hypothetical protein
MDSLERPDISEPEPSSRCSISRFFRLLRRMQMEVPTTKAA